MLGNNNFSKKELENKSRIQKLEAQRKQIQEENDVETPEKKKEPMAETISKKNDTQYTELWKLICVITILELSIVSIPLLITCVQLSSL